jgi:TonB family protein
MKTILLALIFLALVGTVIAGVVMNSKPQEVKKEITKLRNSIVKPISEIKYNSDGYALVVMDSEPEEITKIRDSLVWPRSERIAHHAGRVVLDVLIDSNGVVERVKYKSATSAAFYKAAADGMMKITFTRPVLNGKHIEVWMRQTLNFKLNKSNKKPNEKYFPGGRTRGLG